MLWSCECTLIMANCIKSFLTSHTYLENIKLTLIKSSWSQLSIDSSLIPIECRYHSEISFANEFSQIWDLYFFMKSVRSVRMNFRTWNTRWKSVRSVRTNLRTWNMTVFEHPYWPRGLARLPPEIHKAVFCRRFATCPFHTCEERWNELKNELNWSTHGSE
jgi:hypothetical protein